MTRAAAPPRFTKTHPAAHLTPTVLSITPPVAATRPTPPPITADVLVWLDCLPGNHTNFLLRVKFQFAPHWTSWEMLWGRFPKRKGIVHLAQGPREVDMLHLLAEVWIRTPQEEPLRSSDIAVSPAVFNKLNGRVNAEESLWFRIEGPPPERLWVRLRFRSPLAIDPWEGWVPVQMDTGPGG